MFRYKYRRFFFYFEPYKNIIDATPGNYAALLFSQFEDHVLLHYYSLPSEICCFNLSDLISVLNVGQWFEDQQYDQDFSYSTDQLPDAIAKEVLRFRLSCCRSEQSRETDPRKVWKWHVPHTVFYFSINS